MRRGKHRKGTLTEHEIHAPSRRARINRRGHAVWRTRLGQLRQPQRGVARVEGRFGFDEARFNTTRHHHGVVLRVVLRKEVHRRHEVEIRNSAAAVYRKAWVFRRREVQPVDAFLVRYKERMRVIAIRKGDALLTLSGRAVLHVVGKRRGHCCHRGRRGSMLSQIQLRTRLGDRGETLHLSVGTGQRQCRISRGHGERQRLHGRERRTIRERRRRGADRRARAVVLTHEHNQHRFQRLHLATTRIGGGDRLEHAGRAHRGLARAVQAVVRACPEPVRRIDTPEVKLTDFRRRTTEGELVRHKAGRHHLTEAARCRTTERHRKVANGAGVERTRAL